MLQKQLIDSLQTVEPAIAVNSLVPMLTHFWFTGTQLMAFNDQIGMATPFRSDFKGAVPAKLLTLLKASDGGDDEVELRGDGSNLQGRVGRGKLKLAMLGDKFLFTMPKIHDDVTSGKRLDSFVDAVEHCLLSIGRDTSTVEHLGVTLEPTENLATLYSTDSSTICRASIKLDRNLKFKSRVILPGQFCEQMLRLYNALSEDDITAGKASFEIAERPIREDIVDRYALFSANGVSLYGRLLGTRSPLNFRSVLENNLPNGYRDALVSVPVRFHSALERASIVCDEKRHHTKLTVRSGRLLLHSQSENEEVRDDLPLKDHPDIEVSVEPKLLRRAVDFDKLLISRQCVALTKGEKLYLVSCH